MGPPSKLCPGGVDPWPPVLRSRPTRTKIESVGSCTHVPAGALGSAPTRTARRVWDAPAPLRLWHLASLDAPTVALVWSCAFAWAAGIRLRPWAPIALALIAWAVYIGDRLLDARAGMQSPPLHLLRDRHYFHWRFRRVLAPVGLFAAAAAAQLVITRLPAAARLPDCAVAAVTLVHFSGVHARGRLLPALRRLLSKPFLIAALFTAGCMLPLAAQVVRKGAVPAAYALALPALFFAALAWLNIRAIAQWESSLPALSSRPLLSSLRWLAASGALLAVLFAGSEPRAAALLAVGTASALLLALLHRLRRILTPVALRAAADLTLLTPALLFLFPR